MSLGSCHLLSALFFRILNTNYNAEDTFGSDGASPHHEQKGKVRVGQTLEHPGLVEEFPAHGRGLEQHGFKVPSNPNHL